MNIFEFIITVPVILSDFAQTVWDVLSYEVDIIGVGSFSGIGLIFGAGLLLIVIRRIVGAIVA